MYDAFEFDGIKSSDYGIYILNFDGFSNDGTVTGSHYTFNTSKPASLDRWNYHGSKIENPLERQFQIGKINCSNESFGFTREEYAFLQNWLERKDGYHYLRFLQDGYEHTYFKCQLTLDYIFIGSQLVGAEVNMTCDAPYGYSDVQNFEIDCNDGDKFQIYNDTDRFGALLFDEVNINCTSDATTLSIKNDMDNKYTLNQNYITNISNCVQDEIIVISNRQIQTSKSKHNIIDDFNFKFPRLIYLPNQRVNTFTITGGSCHLFFSYRTIRTVIV